MKESYSKVRDYVLDLGYTITVEDETDGVLVIEDEQAGIKNLVLGCADPILIMEQFIFQNETFSVDVLNALMMKNRDIIHGAFVMDETGKKILFRDTLQLENLDRNELEGSLNSLTMLLTEYTDELIQFSKN